MMHHVIYPYASGDLLEERNNYFYSSYHGEKFLDAWQVRRREGCGASVQTDTGMLSAKTETDHLIMGLKKALSKSSHEATAALAQLDRLVQRFEVTKRIFDAYDDSWRALDRTRYHNAVSYALLSGLLSEAVAKTGSLTYMNALLKCNDILNAIDLPRSVLDHLPSLFANERAHLERIRATLPILSPSEPKSRPADNRRNVTSVAPQVLTGVIMIACGSARSQAYIQTMLARGMAPEEVIFLGPDKERSQSDHVPSRHWGGLFLPDLSESFSITCAKHGIRVRTTASPDVNSDEVLQALKATDAHIVIYSGISGQIVQKCILEAGPRFLHMHAGWLPEYRGSTTVYYSILSKDLPGVSAILLDVNIDTGPILKRQCYQMPPAWMDVDLVYDGAIRADLLCQVMEQYQEQGELFATAIQDPNIGRTYYVIHPVLKHIALLSIGATPNDV